MLGRLGTWIVLSGFFFGSAIVASIGYAAEPAQVAAKAPPGRYATTCRDIVFPADGQGTLAAICRARDGGWRAAALAKAADCRTGIRNENGALVCVGAAIVAPAGDYVASCRGIRTLGYDLFAECRTTAGAWRSAKFTQFNQCTTGLYNDAGVLRCTGQALNRSERAV